MADKNAAYKQFEHFLTALLFLALALFVLYLVGAGVGVLFLKILGAVASILVAGFSLWNLYRTNELLRQRSLWLTLGFGAIVLLTLVSLIFGYPAPK